MSRGKGRSTPTLGDLASDFLAQWKASRTEMPAQTPAHERVGTPTRSDRDVAQTLRHWKRHEGKSKGAKGQGAKGKRPTIEKRRTNPQASSPRKQRLSPDPRSRMSAQTFTRIYRPAPTLAPANVAETTSLRERLAEASADVRDLQIAAAMSRARGLNDLPPVAESPGGRLVILGMDFGTAFTKCVVGWGGRRYAVDWSDAVEGDDRYLLASVFSESSDGRCALGVQEAPGWSVHEGIKLRLLNPEPDSSEMGLADAVMFIALVFRHVDAWLRRVSQDAAAGLRWRLHVGLPTRSWDDDATTHAFKTVAQAARLLACHPGAVTRSAALAALGMTDQVARPAVDVFPEFACQLYSYLLSPERKEDLHALVDIGAGTLDVAYFNVFTKDDQPVLPIFASAVERLGSHYLVAALSGKAGGAVWADSESSLTDDQVATKLGCARNEVSSRRSLYLNSVAEVFNRTTYEAKQTYPTSPAVRGAEHIRLFVCGGGSRIPDIRKRFDRIARESASCIGLSYQVSSLVQPRDIVGQLGPGFDRLSVAYGLSQNAANIGHVLRSASLEPLLPREREDEKHRDDDR